MVGTLASAKDNLGGRVWSRDELSFERDAEVFGRPYFVLKHCNVHLSENICKQYDANLCRPRFQQETSFAFCTVHRKKFRQAVNHTGVQNPRHASTVKHVRDGSTGGFNFGKE